MGRPWQSLQLRMNARGRWHSIVRCLEIVTWKFAEREKARMLVVRAHNMLFLWLCKNPAVTDPTEFTSAANHATMEAVTATAMLDVETVTSLVTTIGAADRVRATAAIDVTGGCSAPSAALCFCPSHALQIERKLFPHFPPVFFTPPPAQSEP